MAKDVYDVGSGSPDEAKGGAARLVSDEKLEAAIFNVGKDWRNAPYFDKAEGGMERQWRSLIWPMIQNCTFDRVVDLACGHGRNTAKLAELSQHVIAIDLNQENVDFCKKRFAETRNVSVVKNDGKSITEVRDVDISLIYCFDSMVHFDSDVIRAYLEDIYRVLRNGGHAFLHHSAMESNPTGSFRDTPGWRNFMSPALMAHWAYKAGLVIVQQKPINWREDVQDCLTLLRRK